MNIEIQASTFTGAKIDSLTIGKLREQINRLNGLIGDAPPALKIVESVHMVEEESIKITRTWRERLFSLPWQPLKATRTEVRLVPRKDAIKLQGGLLVVHPVVAARLRAALDGKGMSPATSMMPSRY